MGKSRKENSQKKSNMMFVLAKVINSVPRKSSSDRWQWIGPHIAQYIIEIWGLYSILCQSFKSNKSREMIKREMFSIKMVEKNHWAHLKLKKTVRNSTIPTNTNSY